MFFTYYEKAGSHQKTSLYSNWSSFPAQVGPPHGWRLSRGNMRIGWLYGQDYWIIPQEYLWCWGIAKTDGTTGKRSFISNQKCSKEWLLLYLSCVLKLSTIHDTSRWTFLHKTKFRKVQWWCSHKISSHSKTACLGRLMATKAQTLNMLVGPTCQRQTRPPIRPTTAHHAAAITWSIDQLLTWGTAEDKRFNNVVRFSWVGSTLNFLG